MKPIFRTLALSTLALTLVGGTAAAFAQDHSDHPDHTQYVKHEEWKKGYHMRQEDWSRGQQVDWHSHHLKQPPSGYEWRQIDGNFVMASGNGVISTTVITR